MSSYNEIDVIEKLNEEILDDQQKKSTENISERRLKQFKEYFPFHIIKWYKKHQSWKVATALSTPVKNVFYATGKPIKDKKGVVYTCVTGGYDCLRE